MIDLSLVETVDDLKLWVKFLDKHYDERYTLKNYYELYYRVCEKFNVTGPLLPHREYRRVKV